MPMVSGAPLCSVTIPFICHPSVAYFKKFERTDEGRLVVKGTCKPRRPMEVRHSIIAVDTAVRMSTAVAFKGGAGVHVHRFLPAESCEKCQIVLIRRSKLSTSA